MSKNGGCKIIRQDMSQGQRYWLLRENYEWQVAYPLLDKGYVSLGFSDAGSKGKSISVSKEYLDLLYGTYGNDRRYLSKFIDEIKDGNYVVIPFIEQFNVYKVEGDVITTNTLYKNLMNSSKDENILLDIDNYIVEKNANNYLESNGKIVDLGFFRKVKLLAEIQKGEEIYKTINSELKDLSALFELSNDTTVHLKKYLVGKQETDIVDQHHKLATVCQERLKKSILEQVEEYLKIIGANLAKNKEGFDAVATFDNVDTKVCVKVQQDSSNIREWVLCQVKQFKDSIDIKQNNLMLWLITSESYCPEFVKRLAGTGLKVDSRKDFEEVYLNVLSYGHKYTEYHLESLHKQIKQQFQPLIKSQINNHTIYKYNEKEKVAFIYPTLFELQNIEYVKTIIKKNVEKNNFRYGVLYSEGFCSVIDKEGMYNTFLSVDINEIVNIVDNNKELLKVKEEQDKACRKLLLSSVRRNDTDISQKGNNKFYFKRGVEKEFWEEFFVKNKINDKSITCRYIPLNTLFEMLKNGTYRMSGLAGMNDVTEVDYFDEYCKSPQTLQTESVNDVFVSCLCPDVDDLTMWRLYADNAAGVCLVFETDTDNVPNFKFYKVQYADRNGYHSSLDLIKKLISTGIEFRHIDEWKHFFKPYEYNIEHEDRLVYFYNRKIDRKWLLTDKNNIVNPVIDFELKDFPLTLKKIILGPKCPEKEINIKQIKAMMQANNIPNAGDIEVVTSSIDNYR